MPRRRPPISAFPATIEPNVGQAWLFPDPRLKFALDVSSSKEIIPTRVESLEHRPGLVKGASQGGRAGTKFLATIREVDADRAMLGALLPR